MIRFSLATLFLLAIVLPLTVGAQTSTAPGEAACQGNNCSTAVASPSSEAAPGYATARRRIFHGTVVRNIQNRHSRRLQRRANRRATRADRAAHRAARVRGRSARYGYGCYGTTSYQTQAPGSGSYGKTSYGSYDAMAYYQPPVSSYGRDRKTSYGSYGSLGN